MSLTYRYNVKGAEFSNFFVANDYAKKTNNYVDFSLSQKDVEIFENIDIEFIQRTNIHQLYKLKLFYLRETFPKLRLWYSAGTDSHTILTIAQKLGIEFDEVVIEHCSMWGDLDLDRETVPGVEYAKKTNIKNFVEVRPTIKDYERYLDNDWVKDTCGSHLFGFRGGRFDWTLRDSTTMVNVTGKDKPWIYAADDGKYYWVITDCSYAQQMRYEHVAFFLDALFPEAAVKQAYASVNYLKIHLPDYRGLWKGEHANKEDTDKIKIYNQAIGRAETLTDDLLVPTRYGKKVPIFRSKKHMGCMEEVHKVGRDDIVEAFYHSLDQVIANYKDQPYCINVTDEGYPTSVLRIASVFEIDDTFIKKVSTDLVDLDYNKTLRR
jgi:hypothetical protein